MSAPWSLIAGIAAGAIAYGLGWLAAYKLGRASAFGEAARLLHTALNDHLEQDAP